MPEPLLSIRNASKHYQVGGGIGQKKREVVALQNFNLDIEHKPATITTIAGESGSGKTTLANVVLGFTSISSGEIFYQGKDTAMMNKQEVLEYRRNVQAVFQDPFGVYNPFYRIEHLFELVNKNFRLTNNPKEARERIEEALNVVGLLGEEILRKYPHQLSGGQRQRIMMARAYLIKPKLIVADEPVSMVDASLRANILETLRSLQRNYGVSIVYITHDLTTAFHIAKSIMVLYRGSVMEAGDVDSVIKNPQHPYTKLLIDSIPWPDLSRRWGDTETKIKEAEGAKSSGCKFSTRCPHVMELCKTPPPLFRLQDYQTASCYLHNSFPKLEPEKLSDTLPV